MNELKTYFFGYNRYENKIISYSTAEQAERSGSLWKQLDSTSYREAKEEFIRIYQEDNSETK